MKLDASIDSITFTQISEQCSPLFTISVSSTSLNGPWSKNIHANISKGGLCCSSGTFSEVSTLVLYLLMIILDEQGSKKVLI